MRRRIRAALDVATGVPALVEIAQSLLRGCARSMFDVVTAAAGSRTTVPVAGLRRLNR